VKMAGAGQLFLVLTGLLALYLTWSNNLNYFAIDIAQRYPEKSQAVQFLLGLQDFFFRDNRPNVTAGFIFDSILMILFAFLAWAFINSTCERRKKDYPLRRLPQVVELFLVSFISIFVGISFCAPIYLALIYSHAFNKKTSGTTTCTGVYLVATVGLLIYVVPSLVAFVEATGGDVSKAWLMWTTDPFANAVTASLLWDILLIAVALAFVQVMHFSRAVSRLPAPIFLVVLTFATLLLILTGGASFTLYYLLVEVSALRNAGSSKPVNAKPKRT